MKLQINSRGSWRDILSFPPERQTLIETLAAELLENSGEKSSIRIATDDNERIAYCAAPDFAWRRA